MNPKMNSENQHTSCSFFRLIPAVTLVLLAFIELNCQNIQDTVPAFPGAMGGGMYTTGGRGGKVVKVTNLNDNGPGSFREATNTKGRRTIVFDVSGTIEIYSELVIKSGDLTIAGQTAPGDGICIKGNEVKLEADNIIIRFIRFRPGDLLKAEYDALTGFGNKNIIIDHCSMSWSTDETVSFYDNKNFTLQWCIVSESLNNSHHRKGAHGYGGIWGGNNASFIFNLMAHHNSRNPRLQGERYNPAEGSEIVEIVNNIIYNWGEKAIYGGEEGSYNLVGNIFIPGPATKHSVADEILDPYEPYGEFFLDGNVFLHENEKWTDAGWENVKKPDDQNEKIMAESEFSLLNNTLPVEVKEAYNLILNFAGASLVRDAVDKRIVEDVQEGKYVYGSNGIIDSQSDTGGWPFLNSFIAPVDTDGDGMPDEWELKHNLNPLDPADGNLFTLDSRYTNLEVYLNHIVRHINEPKFNN